MKLQITIKQIIFTTSNFLLATLCQSWVLANQNNTPDCVKIYYNPHDKEYFIYLQNLLGHFPQFQQILQSIEDYKKGDIEECRASFYIGDGSQSKIPEEFLEDFTQTKKSVTWLGFGVNTLGEKRLNDLFGYRYNGTVSLDKTHLDEKGRPTFYKDIYYKGEKFYKYGDFTRDKKEFRSSYPMVSLIKESDTGKVLAEAEHSYSQERLPYAIRGGNHYYIADVPFTYRHDSDRYLIFADLLFDILGVSPLYPDKHPALIRVEDVNMTTPQDTLIQLVKTLNAENVPNQIALIPIYSNPFNPYGPDHNGLGVPIDQSPEFTNTIETLKNLGSTFVWHGVTHQYGHHKNPHGVSSDDFEFVISSTGKPIPEDSVDYVFDLLNRGWTALSNVGLHPDLWEVPHYAASALDYTLFARVFSWNYGKIRYVPHSQSGLNEAPNNSFWYETNGLDGDLARRKIFSDLRVTETGDSSMQFFPYEIYGDVYGQRVLPENLDYARMESPGIPARTFDDILSCAKRNLVIRDSWASLFLHVSYIRALDAQSPPKSGRGLEKTKDLLQAMKDLGYEFLNADQFIAPRKKLIRPNPVLR